ncbi:MAG: hypothetical protein IBJ11_11355 [Phycisphaerales bacterium]|nr:hypothetical protein [Phycisphaerales bacterium]
MQHARKAQLPFSFGSPESLGARLIARARAAAAMHAQIMSADSAHGRAGSADLRGSEPGVAQRLRLPDAATDRPLIFTPADALTAGERALLKGDDR